MSGSVAGGPGCGLGGPRREPSAPLVLGGQRAGEARVVTRDAVDQAAAAAVARRLGDASVLEDAKPGADGQRAAGLHAARAEIPRPLAHPHHLAEPEKRTPEAVAGAAP